MGRLHTMARFDETIEDGKVVTNCEQCIDPLYVGQSVVKYDSEFFCSTDCLFKYIGAEEKDLEADDYQGGR